jgi:small-conductance mechanosensitive channel
VTVPLPSEHLLNQELSNEDLARDEKFASGAFRRIQRFMIALALLFALAVWLRLGWKIALGFVAGGAISYLNFYSLKRVVNALADRATQTGKGGSSTAVVLRFMLRYFLMAGAAYAILSGSPVSLYGFLAGLFLPVAAIGCEAAYEVYNGLAHGA